MKELFNKIPEEKRKRIIDAAIEQFASRGYENATTAQIAKKAGISTGSIFQYFDNKEDLFLTMVRHCSELLQKEFSDVIKDNASFYTVIERILRRILKTSRQSPHIVKLYFEISSPGKTDLVKHVVNQLEDYSHELYNSLIITGQEQGIISKDIDIPMFSFLLDNIFMMLQFSVSCEYYRERLKIYGAEDILSRDDYIVEQCLNFIKKAFS